MANVDRDIYLNERRAITISATVGILLLAIKFTAYALTGSSAIFSDALESIVNVLASGFALYAIILAHAPADDEHPYGHGKVEFLSAGFEGGLMLLASVVIFFKAVEQMVQKPKLEELGLGLILLIAAMVVNGLVGGYLVRAGRKSGSITLEADGWHLLSDAITSGAVLGALGIIRLTGWNYLDPIAAIGVAGYIVFVAFGLLKRSAAGLMDRQDEDDARAIAAILDAHMGASGKEPQICSYHKLRHRHSGRYHWVDFHIMVPPQLNVDEGHRIASSIEYEIEQMLGVGNATAHVEPCKEENCTGCPANKSDSSTDCADSE